MVAPWGDEDPEEDGSDSSWVLVGLVGASVALFIVWVFVMVRSSWGLPW